MIVLMSMFKGFVMANLMKMKFESCANLTVDMDTSKETQYIGNKYFVYTDNINTKNFHGIIMAV
jgi:hypothetical protein